MALRGESSFGHSHSHGFAADNDNNTNVSQADVTCAVLSVRTRPFAVPRGLLKGSHSSGGGGSANKTVSCEVADAAGGNEVVSILVTQSTPMAAPVAVESPADASAIHVEDDDGADGSRPHSPAGRVDGSMITADGYDATAAALAQSSEASSFVIQQVPLHDPIVVWRLARFLKLQSSISPRLAPNILPLIAAYRHSGGGDMASSMTMMMMSMASSSNNNNNVTTHSSSSSNPNISTAIDRDPLQRLIDPATAHCYVAQPHVTDTLAAVARAAPRSLVQLPQIRTVCRELLDALALLHASKIVVNDLTPSTVRVNLGLKSRADVAIAMSRPVLAFTPMPGKLFLKLLDLPRYGHRYLAPEVVVQLAQASTARALSTTGPEFASPRTDTVTVSPAADIWSLGCILVELVLGRPLFPSESLFEHGKVVSHVLEQPFPEKPPANLATNTSPTRVGIFTGVHMPSALHAALLSAADAPFRQLVAAMLQMDPALRPTAEEIINQATFVSMNLGGNVTGGSGHVRAHGGRMIGGRRNSATSSGSRPQQQQQGKAVAVGTSASISSEMAAAGTTGEISKEWAVPEPGQASAAALFEMAPVMP